MPGGRCALKTTLCVCVTLLCVALFFGCQQTNSSSVDPIHGTWDATGFMINGASATLAEQGLSVYSMTVGGDNSVAISTTSSSGSGQTLTGSWSKSYFVYGFSGMAVWDVLTGTVSGDSLTLAPQGIGGENRVYFSRQAGSGRMAAAPTFSPAGGTYSGVQSVTIRSGTGGASIRYTTDGTLPTCESGNLYLSPVTVGASKTLRAIAFKEGMTDSAVSSAGYVISLPVTGTLSGTVKNPIADSGLAGVTVSAYSGASLSGSTTTGSGGSFTLNVTPGSAYQLTFQKAGFLGTTYHGVGVAANTTTYLETVQLVDNSHSGTGTVSGAISNAFNGAGVSGASLNLRVGIGATTGNVLHSDTTGSNGGFTIANVPGGNYTAEVSKSGCTTMFYTPTAVGGLTRANQNASITSLLSSQEVRFVLTWGAVPGDLDSHMKTPDLAHVYYSSKGSSSSAPFTALDHDVTSGYGPETVTVYSEQGGDYYYYVHNYTNMGLTSSMALANSGAQVSVYVGSSLAGTYNVPQFGGTLWKVLKLNGTTITPINSMLYEASSSNVSARAIAGDELAEFRNLPAKR